MRDIVDTRSLPLDEDIPEGIFKIQSDQIAGSDVYYDASGLTPTDEYQYPSKLPTTRVSVVAPRQNLLGWVSSAATRVSKSLITSLAAAQINIARLSYDNLPTGALEQAVFVQIIGEHHSFHISVSSDLITTREGVASTSLLAPSGAYLTWVEMMEEIPK